MEKIAVFSISSSSHIDNADVALTSFSNNCDLKVDCYNLSIEDIRIKKEQNFYIQSIYDKYIGIDENILRWCLKPALIAHFLTDLQYEKCIYIDNDIYFVNNITFLVNCIQRGILLTKHNRPILPSPDSASYYQFVCNFTDGFFNAGFVGANKFGLDALIWWHTLNLWKCEKNKRRGLHVDQKYLDILALNFNSVTDICDHSGCNLALWNTTTIKRSHKNKWIVGDDASPAFCHFSGMNLKNYLNYINYDPMLVEYYQEYITKIKKCQTKKFTS